MWTWYDSPLPHTYTFASHYSYIRALLAQCVDDIDILDKICSARPTPNKKIPMSPTTNRPSNAREDFNETIKDIRDFKSRRHRVLANMMETNGSFCQQNMIAYFHTRQMPLPGSTLLNAAEVQDKINELLTCCKLSTLTEFQLKHGSHYGILDEKGRLITYMCFISASIKNVPGSTAVSIELLAGIDNKHNSSHMFAELTKILRRRKHFCIIFAQCAKTPEAKRFWNGKMTNTYYASMYVGLFYHYDNAYTVYEDVIDKALVIHA